MWRRRVLQIKITENSTAELQSATQTQKEEGGGRGGGGGGEMKERKVWREEKTDR